MRIRASKRLAVVAGLALSLATAGSAMAFFELPDLNISPTIAPVLAPHVDAPSVDHSFNIVDSFLLNSHNSGSSDFIDMNEVGNISHNSILALLNGLLF